MNRIKKGWEVFKISFKIAQKVKTVWLLIVSSVIAELLFTFSYAVGMYVVAGGNTVTNLQKVFSEFEKIGSLPDYQLILSALGYTFISIFIMTFFNFAISYNILEFLKKEEKISFSKSVAFSFSRIKDITMWSLVLSTVNLIFQILNMIAEKLGKIGEIIMKIINGLLGAAWSLLTLFVVPIYVENENISVKSALKSSKDMFVKTWGETMVAGVSVGFFSGVFIFGIVIILGVLTAFAQSFIILMIVLDILSVLFVIVFTNAMDKVFKIIIYIYASTGEVPYFVEDKSLITESFVRK